jgi:hypothetical protein
MGSYYWNAHSAAEIYARMQKEASRRQAPRQYAATEELVLIGPNVWVPKNQTRYSVPTAALVSTRAYYKE